jgi:hypothetical protein
VSARREQGEARTPEIHVHIERLVVHGLDVRDRATLGAAVAEGLSEAFTRHGWEPMPDADLAAKRVDAGSITQGSRIVESELGASVADAVHRGVTR